MDFVGGPAILYFYTKRNNSAGAVRGKKYLGGAGPFGRAWPLICTVIFTGLQMCYWGPGQDLEGPVSPGPSLEPPLQLSCQLRYMYEICEKSKIYARTLCTSLDIYGWLLTTD